MVVVTVFLSILIGKFGSRLKGKLSPRSYPIQCERKWKYSFLSVVCIPFQMYFERISSFSFQISVKMYQFLRVLLTSLNELFSVENVFPRIFCSKMLRINHRYPTLNITIYTIKKSFPKFSSRQLLGFKLYQFQLQFQLQLQPTFHFPVR